MTNVDPLFKGYLPAFSSTKLPFFPLLLLTHIFFQRTMEIFCYFLNFQPLALAFVDDSCLNPLFWRLPSGGFSIPMILIKGRGWLSVPRCLLFRRVAGGIQKEQGGVLGSDVLISPQQVRAEMTDFVPNAEVLCQEGFAGDSVVPLMPFQRPPPARSGGALGLPWSEGSPLPGAGLPQEGTAFWNARFPTLWHCVTFFSPLMVHSCPLADGGQKADYVNAFV